MRQRIRRIGLDIAGGVSVVLGLVLVEMLGDLLDERGRRRRDAHRVVTELVTGKPEPEPGRVTDRRGDLP